MHGFGVALFIGSLIQHLGRGLKLALCVSIFVLTIEGVAHVIMRLVTVFVGLHRTAVVDFGFCEVLLSILTIAFAHINHLALREE